MNKKSLKFFKKNPRYFFLPRICLSHIFFFFHVTFLISLEKINCTFSKKKIQRK